MSKQFWVTACKATLGDPPQNLAISLGAIMVICLLACSHARKRIAFSRINTERRVCRLRCGEWLDVPEVVVARS
jgi:hypothetical protein